MCNGAQESRQDPFFTLTYKVATQQCTQRHKIAAQNDTERQGTQVRTATWTMGVAGKAQTKQGSFSNIFIFAKKLHIKKTFIFGEKSRFWRPLPVSHGRSKIFGLEGQHPSILVCVSVANDHSIGTVYDPEH